MKLCPKNILNLLQIQNSKIGEILALRFFALIRDRQPDRNQKNLIHNFFIKFEFRTMAIAMDQHLVDGTWSEGRV